jgi:hypothetical protein
MKMIIIWVAICLGLGVGGGVYYLNRPDVVQARVQNTLLHATPNASVALAPKKFTNHGHTYRLNFYQDALVATGPLASNSKQDAILARPGRTATSFVLFASPIDDAHTASRSDCGIRSPASVEFTVDYAGSQVSVCHATSPKPYRVYIMDVRSKGTWEELTLFNSAGVDQTSHDKEFQSALSSLSID